MFELNVYSLSEFSVLEKLFLLNNINKDLVFLCIGTQKYYLDSFGVKIGDKLKKLNFFVYGSSKREINGNNFLKVYEFIKKKHPNSKIIVIDSVYVKGNKKPVLIYKNTPINAGSLIGNYQIGHEGILFNSFSYSKIDDFNKIINLITNFFAKLN